MQTKLEIVNPKSSLALPLMEDFLTIQGEGYHQGKAAYFLRLGGCDVGCVWCDVKDSWRMDHPLLSVSEMTTRAKMSGAPMVVVTGGEPAMYDLNVLTYNLRHAGLRTHLETSGAYPITGMWDWVCLSPKKFKEPHPTAYLKADEIKVVIYNKSDFTWARQEAAKVRPECLLFLQPEWSREKEMLPSIVEYVKDSPQWRISLQVHKYMNIP